MFRVQRIFAIAVTLCLLPGCLAEFDDLPQTQELIAQGETHEIAQELGITQSYDPDVSADVQPRFWGDVGSYIVGLVKSSLEGKAVSVIQDVIFGSGGANFVHLSEQSLQQIENAIERQLDNIVEGDAIADLGALELGLEQYNDVLDLGQEDDGLLLALNNEARFLYEHQAFDSDYHPDYWMLTGHLVLVATIRTAVIRERVRRDLNSFAFLSAEATEMADRLEIMGQNADSNIRANVYTTAHGNCNGPEPLRPMPNEPSSRVPCLMIVHDDIAGTSRGYSFSTYGTSVIEVASNARDAQRLEYEILFKGENNASFSQIINDLRNL